MQFQIETETGTYTTREGTVRRLEHEVGPIFIIDGLLKENIVAALYSELRHASFRANDYDTDAYSDILHMKCELPADALMAGEIGGSALQALLPSEVGAVCLSALALITARAVNELYPNYRDIEILRIHANSIPYGDYLTTHKDGQSNRALTGLYFANATWEAEWHGDLILHDAGGESQYAVAPKPGRIVLFPGDLPHRAGCPSRGCFVNRLTVSHKFSAVREDWVDSGDPIAR